jgi:hypothetical protein
MCRIVKYSLIVLALLGAVQTGVFAQQPLPPAFAIPAPGAMTPQQKLAASNAKSAIQQTCDQMDLALQQKRLADFLAHRDPTFASINANGEWESASNCRSDTVALFANLLSGDKRTVVQTIALKGKLAEAYVSRHGSLVAKNPSTKLYDTICIDAESRDVFEFEGGHWVQYRSYTIAEQDIVNGKLVVTAPRVAAGTRAVPSSTPVRTAKTNAPPEISKRGA